MKLQQISVFLENKPGSLSAPAKALAEAGLNIVTMSLADTQQFGILRLIMPEWQRAGEVLKGANFVVKVSEVVAVEVDDRPGGLHRVLSAIEQAGLNVEYTYAFTYGRAGTAVLIFRFEEPDRAVAELQHRGINVVGQVDLFARAGQG